MNLAQALDLLEKVETQLASLYRHFSEVTSNDPEVSRLFAALAEDEESHRLSIRYQQRVVRANAKGFNDIELNVEALSALVKAIEQMKGTKAITAGAALEFAREIELSAGEHHLKNVLGSRNPEIANLLKNLGNGDEEHLRRLTAVSQKRSSA